MLQIIKKFLILYILLEIKEDRFRVTTYETGIFNSTSGKISYLTKDTGIYKKWSKAYKEEHDKIILELETIAKSSESSDF